MSRLILTIATVSMCFPSLAFAAGKDYLRMYDGPPLPRESVAILATAIPSVNQDCSPFIYLTELDGKTGMALEYVTFELLPGQHNLRVFAGRGGVHSSEFPLKPNPPLGFNAEAGHVYAVICRTTPGQHVWSSKFHWDATIADITVPSGETACASTFWSRKDRSPITGRCIKNPNGDEPMRKQLWKRIEKGFAQERGSSGTEPAATPKPDETSEK